MKPIKKFDEFLNESVSNDLKSDALEFIKKYLGIKSKVSLNHTPSKYNKDLSGYNMANVGFSNSKGFEINIDFNETKFGFVRRLAHEMVHVKQIEDGRLKRSGDNFSFDGKIYSKKEYEKSYHQDKIPEFEEEAFDQERIIANAFWNK